jgi:hypothetical protein
MNIINAAQERNKRLSEMARAAIAQYNVDMAAGGEPVYPDWAIDLLWLTKSANLSVVVQDRASVVRMPSNIGKSQQERDFEKMVRADRAALVLLGACLALTCVLFGLLERVPA